MKVLLVDHYDSFTYNLFQYLGELLEDELDSRFRLDVFRHDEIEFSKIETMKYDRIVLSPGPGTPKDPKYFGVSAEILLKLDERIPILGVCLGMQGMAFVAGASVVPASVPMHGKVSAITHDGKGVFTDLPKDLNVMRYHSLVVDPSGLSDEWILTAFCGKELMGIRHKRRPLEGIQFHPESFATEGGRRMLSNFLFPGQSG
ncbi:anthranilate synthase component II [Leptospira fainei serovar Hurstbridge str. BUT 6]|uniref:Anthranilate synthase component II n=1 Tax=Leptospira fainei serovar Hurstbridge str. BUT 6 TaxID=1193011 RepID=S3W1J6_9LEPT|nr:aminodeoxychorismate/anthranilate synthase component II [Leptospira fainei]EPG74172.1 anthranilate synthase component II [Leptospira fainei serovar Hurstbridge str. BUT 6]